MSKNEPATRSINLFNPETGEREVVLLDGTPETSRRLNTLMQSGFKNEGVVNIGEVAKKPYAPIYKPDTDIPSINLPQPDPVDWRFPEGFDEWYSGVLDAQTRNIGDLYDFDPPRATPAQLDIYGTGPGRGPYGEPAGYEPGGQPTGRDGWLPPFLRLDRTAEPSPQRELEGLVGQGQAPQNLTLVNPQTGAQQIISLDNTPQTSTLLNDLVQQGFVPQDSGALQSMDAQRSQIAPDGTLVQAPPDDLSMAPPIRYDDGMTFAPDYYGPEGFPPRRQFGGIPQPRAQTPQQFEALQFLLSGQGYDPATMARMRAGATDAAAMAGRSQAGTARLMGQQSGLAGSPAALALEAGARRRQGDVTTRALNEIEIANAMQGMQNLQTGAGMELNRQTAGASMANQMALANASNILSGMQQNVANQQQTNLFNIGNRMGQQMTQAGQQAQLYGTGAQNWNQAQTQRANQAAFFNPGQQMARDFTQAELDRQEKMAEAGFDFNWGSGARDILARQATPGGAAPYYAGWQTPQFYNPLANINLLR